MEGCGRLSRRPVGGERCGGGSVEWELGPMECQWRVSRDKSDHSGHDEERGGLVLRRVSLGVVEAVGCKETIGSLSGSSVWKRARFLTMSFENSRGR